ncbi:hypothetical protein Sjap_001112 [Stephania japonica]|uniref:NAC domain-containing protein n=1 Tax=Stephania japonica TaxID=461633 RepID=A0AAP0KLM4_9MAGN
MEDLPPGFRFYPTEEELISFYLHHKLQATRPQLDRVIPVVDIYELEPSHLPPEYTGELCQGDPEQWFFFSARQEREARGGRPSRTTSYGYWKATGSPSFVRSSTNQIIGMKKTMVFYRGRAPNGRKTNWKMNEYKQIKQPYSPNDPQLRHEFSLCRVYIKTGRLRSFDRRPIEAGAAPQLPDFHGDHQHSGDDQVRMMINPPLLADDQSSSSACPANNSPDPGQTSITNNIGEQSGDHDNWQMDQEDLQLLLELEKLNWV